MFEISIFSIFLNGCIYKTTKGTIKYLPGVGLGGCVKFLRGLYIFLEGGGQSGNPSGYTLGGGGGAKSQTFHPLVVVVFSRNVIILCKNPS